MKKGVILIFVVTMVALAALAFAVPAGKTLTYEGKGMGKVTFSGDVHANAGLSCNKCHNKDMFAMMKHGAAKFKMADIYAGKYCGACHNGSQAFAPAGNCARCHKK
ncbi:MAG: cytochrome c3 family protein [Thermodesulfovibrionales bacterium]|nr:cytochrome c3 family protein [Thermodesulfovibrionales bacterium]